MFGPGTACLGGQKVPICVLYQYSSTQCMYLQLLFCPNILKEIVALVCFLDSIVLERNFLRSLCWVTGRVPAELKV